MKIVVLVLALAATPAAAQSMKIEDLCVKVAKHLLMTENLHTGVVQSFPELKPPGARLTYSTRDGVEKKDMVDTISCEFAQTRAPFGLQRFCLASTCYSTAEKNPENKRRFEEVNTLMEREGL
ncbi:hypothetical protein OIU34_35310 [Pararhizobium sp. BT-229]|uniref:hypothetical protein n=1 Tax=Pararhizobium sp. BT-229 TaxID=2986923 RepID=UPI0021F737F9|nr:hypothetical protein [Pararhizobium sp. BT-229]MCV9967103.1 hypothetical protein [Pararhizobium sp. BT-229]